MVADAVELGDLVGGEMASDRQLDVRCDLDAVPGLATDRPRHVLAADDARKGFKQPMHWRARVSITLWTRA